MACAPTPPKIADPFGFPESLDANARAMANLATLWFAPWRAWTALALEAMDPRNHAVTGSVTRLD